MDVRVPSNIVGGFGRLMFGAACLLIAAIQVNPSAAQAQSQITVEQLLTEGWEIAGYTSPSSLSLSFVLFKHKDRHYLVQCSILYDVTRSQRIIDRVVTNCYEVR
jgi:hypothetical protein